MNNRKKTRMENMQCASECLTLVLRELSKAEILPLDAYIYFDFSDLTFKAQMRILLKQEDMDKSVFSLCAGEVFHDLQPLETTYNTIDDNGDRLTHRDAEYHFIWGMMTFTSIVAVEDDETAD